MESWQKAGIDGGMEGWRRRDGETLAPEPGVVPVQAGTEGPPGHEELGARGVVAVGVHRVGEGADVGEITPPRLVMVQPAAACGQFEDALPWA